jgi:hypothetical protein
MQRKMASSAHLLVPLPIVDKSVVRILLSRVYPRCATTIFMPSLKDNLIKDEERIVLTQK